MRVLFYFVLGLILGLWLREFLGEGEPSRSQPTPRLPARTQTRTTDPLVEIVGIGPVFEDVLHDIGIFTFADLARQDAEELAERMGGRITADRIRRERWIEQAQNFNKS